MVTIRELKGWPHVFTLTDGSTFRIFPHEEKPIDPSAVSEDLERGAKMGYVAILREVPKSETAVEEHSGEPAPKKGKK